MSAPKRSPKNKAAMDRLLAIHRKVGPASEPELSDALGEPIPEEDGSTSVADKQARARAS